MSLLQSFTHTLSDFYEYEPSGAREVWISRGEQGPPYGFILVFAGAIC